MPWERLGGGWCIEGEGGGGVQVALGCVRGDGPVQEEEWVRGVALTRCAQAVAVGWLDT